MGVWVTTTSLETKMIGTVFDSATVSLASASIYDAENELKKHLCKRYDFTDAVFASAGVCPPMLKTLTETLALGYMYENMSRGSDESYKRADRYIQRVMDNVKSLLEGEAQLTDTSGNLVSEIDGDWAIHCNTTDYTPTFNEDEPTAWTPDQDKLDDISDSRD